MNDVVRERNGIHYHVNTCFYYRVLTLLEGLQIPVENLYSMWPREFEEPPYGYYIWLEDTERR